MKIILPVFALAIVLASCTEPKVQLRAAETAEMDTVLVKDSVKVDTSSVAKKN